MSTLKWRPVTVLMRAARGVDVERLDRAEVVGDLAEVVAELDELATKSGATSSSRSFR